MTSLPIPSAGIKPILSVFLAAVARGRNAMVVCRLSRSARDRRQLRQRDLPAHFIDASRRGDSPSKSCCLRLTHPLSERLW